MTPAPAPSRSPLRRVLDTPPPPPPAEERCELCSAALGGQHGHLVDLQQRGLLCCCRPCTLLFTRTGSGGGRYRTVPERVHADPESTVSDAEWDQLQIPVAMAFFFIHSDRDGPVAFYPSPAGATESELPLTTWEGGLGGTALARALEPDVEALLVRRHPGAPSECYLVPIDVCYELVGLVRLHWRGFDGSEAAWAVIDELFADLRERSRPL